VDIHDDLVASRANFMATSTLRRSLGAAVTRRPPDKSLE
jgi:hypothetical protein